MISDYRKHFLTKVKQMIDSANQVERADWAEISRVLNPGRALPKGLDMGELFDIDDFTTKIMK